MTEYEKMQAQEDDHRNIRMVAFVAVVISTVAVVAAVITLPMLYQYVQTLQSHMMEEVDFCKVRDQLISKSSVPCLCT